MTSSTRLVKAVLLLLGILTASVASAAETVTHQYDALGRLKQTTSSGGPATGTQTSLTYDAAGNRTNVSVSGSANTLPSFAVANAAAVTGGNPLVFTVTRSGTATATLTVNYATSNGTASAGTDYTAASGTLTFLVGEASKTVSVSTLTPPTAGTRTVMINLSGASGGATITTAQASGSVTFAGSSAPIVLTTNTLTVLPTHASMYYCTSGGGSNVCILTTTGVAVLNMYQGSITSIKTGYSINWLGELEVLSAYYGTAM